MTFKTWIGKSLLTGFFTMIAVCYGHAAIIFVDSTATAGADNGTSWQDAYLDLNSALTTAVAADEIWVANGTYYPGASGARLSRYNLVNGVAVYGGFEGLGGAEETMLSQRDWVTNRCILSGDLNQSGTRDTLDAYHVLSGITRDSTAIVDGFTITMGAANGPGIDNFGGGATMFNGGGTIRNCIFEKNYSSNIAGAVYANRGSRFINCTFRNNRSDFRAGACYFTGSQPIKVFNCTFSGNTASNLAGALFAQNPNLRIFQCSFSENDGLLGSGIYCVNAGVQVKNSIFWDNVGAEIGGTSPQVSHCIVDGGYANGSNIIDEDPRFADTLLHLLACSPAVDAGDSLTFLTDDQDGNSRPFDGDNDLIAKWDLGAFESQLQGVTPLANPITGRNPACALGQDEPYTVTTNNSPTSVYTWSLSGGGAIDGPGVGDTVLIDWGNVLGTYQLVMTETVAATGCFNTDTLTISLDTVPIAMVSPVGNDSVCTGDSLQLTASGVGASFQWTLNGNPISGATGSQFFAGPQGFYNVILTDGNGCSDTAASGLNLFNHPLPVVNITPFGGTGLCIGESLTLTANGGVSRQWFLDGQALSGQTGTSLTVTNGGSFNMIQTDAQGCSDSSALATVVTLHPLPVVSVNPSAGTDTICPGDSLLINATAAGAVSFQWLLDGAALGGANTNPIPAMISGHYNVLLTDSNSCVDSASIGHDVLVGDFILPNSLCRDTTIYLDNSGSFTIDPSFVDNGSNDNCGIDSVALSQGTFNCSDTGTVPIVVTVFDATGNSSSCNASVIVVDSTRPTAICQNANLFLDGSGQLTVLAADIDGGSGDNCGIDTAFVDQVSFACADTGSHSLTLSVRDVSGNLSTCNATIQVADSSSPNAVCQDTVVFLDAGGNASITAQSVENGSSDNCGINTISVSQSGFGCADVPSVQVSLTLTDVSGNMATCLAQVRVRDTVPPVAACRDTLIYIDNTGQAILSPSDVDAGSSDNCTIAFAGLSQGTFTCADTGANSVTLNIVDADTNASSCISLVTIRDTVAPTAICSDTTFYIDSFGVAIVDPLIFGANSVDNCISFDTAYVDVAPFGCADLGQYTVQLVISDFSGQMDSCTGLITIADSTGPFALCRDTNLVLGPGGFVLLDVADLDLGTSDNCSLDSLFISQDSFTCADVGLNMVELTGVDALGNSSSCFAQVIIVDSVSPTAACQDTLLFLGSGGTAQLQPSDLDDGSLDNCLVDSFALSQSTFGCQDTGLIQVTLTVYDGFGNPGSCLAQVTVRDTTSPTAVCQDTMVYLDGNGNHVLNFNEVAGSSFDNCLIFTTSLSAANFTCVDTGLNPVSVLVTDPSGNQSICISQVTVVDSLAPVLDCRDSTFYLDSLGQFSLQASMLTGNSNDNCQIDTAVLNQTTFDCSDVGTTSLNLTVTDVNSNTSLCNPVLTLLDTLGPIMRCMDTTLILDTLGNVTLLQSMVDAGSFDACGISFSSLSQTDFDCSNIGNNPVALLLEDANGNSSVCLVNVIVQDTGLPVAACTSLTIYIDGAGNVPLTPADLDDGSRDDCGIDTLILSPAGFTCADSGTNFTELIVVDFGGNSDTCQTTVIVLDTLAPVAVCDSFVLQLDSNGLVVVQPLQAGPGSMDNCTLDSVWVDQDTFTCGDLGFNPISLFLIDDSGNRDSCDAVLEVVDTTGASAAAANLGPDQIACNGDTVLLSPGNGFQSYNWSTGEMSSAIQVDTAGTYWVDVVNQLGCLGTDTIVIGAHQVSSPMLTSESGEMVICLNDSLELQASPGFVSYLWSNGDTNASTTVYSGGNYALLVTDATGCTRLDELTINFSPTPAPNPMIVPGPSVNLCESETVELEAGTGYFSYLWSNGATTENISVSQGGTYFVEVWNGFGCHTVAPAVTVSPAPNPLPIVAIQGDSLVCTTLGSGYQWYQNSNPLFGATDPVFVPTGSGNYTVVVSYLNGCSRSSLPTSVMVSMDEASQLLAGLVLYPNPARGEAFLRTTLPIPGKTRLELVDIYGKVLKTFQWKSWQGERSIDLQGIPGGIYQLRIEHKRARALRKLVVH